MTTIQFFITFFAVGLFLMAVLFWAYLIRVCARKMFELEKMSECYGNELTRIVKYGKQLKEDVGVIHDYREKLSKEIEERLATEELNHSTEEE